MRLRGVSFGSNRTRPAQRHAERQGDHGLVDRPHRHERGLFLLPEAHLGATAWAALAATGWNPFTGGKIN
jgi:hypothetical protein